MSRILALDPSFSRTGAVQIDTEKMEVRSHRVSTSIPVKSFLGINDGVTTIIEQLDPLVRGATNMIMEGPFPNSNFSAGLFALDTSIYRRYSKHVETVVVNPNTMGHIHGKRSYAKSESVTLAKSMLTIMEGFGYRDLTGRKWTHDESEAFIYGVALAVSKGLFAKDLEKVLREKYRNLPLKGV